ncbi:MAG: RlmF-related methyltransferase [Bacteroidota bacterium]|nr:RlmF-related methyltransferase [Bacteroidota bacterium]
MHPNNIHQEDYPFNELIKAHPPLSKFTVQFQDKPSINFNDSLALKALNNALLVHYYGITPIEYPHGYLLAPVPSRVDYIHHIADEVKAGAKGLDIGCGATAIYSLLGASCYNFNMIGSEVSEKSYAFAKANTKTVPSIDIRLQSDRGSIFKNIIQKGEYLDFTICNPPFFSSEQEAMKAFQRKAKNLGGDKKHNFSGTADELWCNGGEALFIKRMIKESIDYKTQVGLFSTLVSQKGHIARLEKLLTKKQANHYVKSSKIGSKVVHYLFWKFR